MSKFQLPKDFSPDFTKQYDNGQHPFTMQVQYKGQVEDKMSVYKWIYAVVVGDVIVRAEPFHWHLPVEEFTNEDAADYLQMFFKDSDQVKNGKPLHTLKIVSKETGKTSDEMFILKAIALVWSIFFTDQTAFPMEELSVTSYTSVLRNKCAIVGVNNNPSLSYEVTYDGTEKKTYVTAYVEIDKYIFTDDELED